VLSFAAVSLLFLSSGFSDPQQLTGVVVDASGRAVPRAVVQIVAGGTPASSTLTETDGTFRVANPHASCRIEVSLPGFSRATAPCDADAPVKVTLQVAPIAEAIVVSATRTEAPAGQAAAAITVFDAADIGRRQQPLLADLLRDAPGTVVVTTGSPGSVTSMFVRGGESNYTKVLLDGIPLNEPGGAFNLSNVTTGNLDRVEMVRGANSALFGSDAMTGVVQLFTHRGTTAKPEVRLGVEGGTFSTGRGSAGVSGGNSRADYSVDATGLTTDNEVANSAFKNFTLSGSGGATLGSGATLRSVFRLERGQTGTPGQTAFQRPDLDAFFQRHDGQWGVSVDQTRGALHQSASYGLAISHQASTNLHADPDYTPSFEGRVAPFPFSDFTYDSRTDLTRHHANYQIDGTIATARTGTHVETALVDWDGERATLVDALAGSSQPASRNNVGVSLQHQALWSRVFVTGGVRFEHNASFGDATTPRVAATWYAHTGDGAFGVTRVHGTAGTGIKEPTILQSFSPNPYFLGNPALQPERSRTVDVGVEQRLAGDRARVDLTWFDNRYRDIVALGEPDPATFYSQYFNIGLTRARGAELSGDVALVHGLRGSAGYTFTDSEIVDSTSSNPVFATGQPAFRRPRHSGYAEVAWNGARASASLHGVFVGERSDSDLSLLEPPLTVNDAYAMWDVRATFSLTRALSLTGAIDNLTNSGHMEPLGYPVLSRAVRAGVRVRF
jgi:vitamin B12 transporter